MTFVMRQKLAYSERCYPTRDPRVVAFVLARQRLTPSAASSFYGGHTPASSLSFVTSMIDDFGLVMVDDDLFRLDGSAVFDDLGVSRTRAWLAFAICTCSVAYRFGHILEPDDPGKYHAPSPRGMLYLGTYIDVQAAERVFDSAGDHSKRTPLTCVASSTPEASLPRRPTVVLFLGCIAPTNPSLTAMATRDSGGVYGPRSNQFPRDKHEIRSTRTIGRSDSLRLMWAEHPSSELNSERTVEDICRLPATIDATIAHKGCHVPQEAFHKKGCSRQKRKARSGLGLSSAVSEIARQRYGVWRAARTGQEHVCGVLVMSRAH